MSVAIEAEPERNRMEQRAKNEIACLFGFLHEDGTIFQNRLCKLGTDVPFFR